MRDVTAANVATYATSWSVSEYTRSQSLTRVEAELVGEAFPAAPARVLDLGCGAGRTTIALARLGYQVVGIDLSERLLEEARRVAPGIDVRNMDAADLQFPDAAFDAALFSFNGLDCLYPLAQRLQCLREVRRVLKPGAPFVLSGHNLLGASFSGGFWYPRGYLNAARFLLRQWRNPLASEWYFSYEDGSGEQLLYSAPPATTMRQLRDAGFGPAVLRGRLGERDPARVRWHEPHVHFVARAVE